MTALPFDIKKCTSDPLDTINDNQGYELILDLDGTAAPALVHLALRIGSLRGLESHLAIGSRYSSCSVCSAPYIFDTE